MSKAQELLEAALKSKQLEPQEEMEELELGLDNLKIASTHANDGAQRVRSIVNSQAALTVKQVKQAIKVADRLAEAVNALDEFNIAAKKL